MIVPLHGMRSKICRPDCVSMVHESAMNPVSLINENSAIGRGRGGRGEQEPCQIRMAPIPASALAVIRSKSHPERVGGGCLQVVCL